MFICACFVLCLICNSAQGFWCKVLHKLGLLFYYYVVLLLLVVQQDWHFIKSVTWYQTLNHSCFLFLSCRSPNKLVDTICTLIMKFNLHINIWSLLMFDIFAFGLWKVLVVGVDLRITSQLQESSCNAQLFLITICLPISIQWLHCIFLWSQNNNFANCPKRWHFHLCNQINYSHKMLSQIFNCSDVTVQS